MRAWIYRDFIIWTIFSFTTSGIRLMIDSVLTGTSIYSALRHCILFIFVSQQLASTQIDSLDKLIQNWQIDLLLCLLSFESKEKERLLLIIKTCNYSNDMYHFLAFAKKCMICLILICVLTTAQVWFFLRKSHVALFRLLFIISESPNVRNKDLMYDLVFN